MKDNNLENFPEIDCEEFLKFKRESPGFGSYWNFEELKKSEQGYAPANFPIDYSEDKK